MWRSEVLNEAEGNYFFIRVKDEYEEKNKTLITLFAQLSVKTESGIQCVWADTEKVKAEQAPPEFLQTPNGLYTYTVSEPVFHELLEIADHSHRELFSLTPFSKASKLKWLF